MPFQSVFNDGTMCIISGLEIIRSWRAYRPWHSEFRAVYQAPDGIKLTGVGSWSHDVVEPRGPSCDGYDPFILPTLERLMQSPKALPRLSNSVSQRLAAIHQNPTDCFRSFPLEICEAIAVQPPTRDLLSLLHVSRVMILIFTSTAFWRTRFTINGERGFLQSCRSKSHRRGRRATLAIYKPLQHQMPLHFGSRTLQNHHNTCYSNTRIESVGITPSLRSIVIPALRISGEDYITGMKFIFDDRPSVLIGYTTPGARVVAMDDEDYEPRHHKYPG